MRFGHSSKYSLTTTVGLCFTDATFFLPAQRCASAVLAVIVCSSVRHIYGPVDINKKQDSLYGSLLITCTALGLHARCAMVVLSATMRVQNYAGSGIKRGSC